MSDAFVILWTVLIFTSVVWYGFLLFYVGAKAGREIKEMIQALESRPDEKKKG